MFVLVLVLAGCSTGQDLSRSSDRLTEFEVYELRSSVIIECMNAAGFDFEPAPYFDHSDSTVRSIFLLTGAREIGYSGLPSLIASETSGNEGPPAGLGASDVEAYDRALMGAGESSHDASEASAGGCRGKGDAAVSVALGSERPEIMTPERAERMGEFLQEVAQLTAFKKFERAWRSCVAEAGYDLGEFFSVGNESFEMAVPLIQSRFVELRETLPELVARMKTDRITPEWFANVLAMDPRLAEIFEKERQQALADQKCRIEYLPTVKEEINQLSVEMLDYNAI